MPAPVNKIDFNEILNDFRGLCIDLSKGMTMSDNGITSVWTANLSRRQFGANGREKKSLQLTMLVSPKSEGPAAALRKLAEMIDQGVVEIER